MYLGRLEKYFTEMGLTQLPWAEVCPHTKVSQTHMLLKENNVLENARSELNACTVA